MLRNPASFVSLFAAPDSTVAHEFVFRGDNLLVREADLALPDGATLRLLAVQPQRVLPVGQLGDQYCRTAWLDADAAPPDGFAFRSLRSLFGSFDDALLAVAGRAVQLANWARTHRHCGACGTATEHVAGERCLRCPACGHAAYPRISPAMMVLIKRGSAILLARHTRSPNGFFTALAGFLEAGESVEDAIHREVYEEVGLQVRDLRYHGSQSWPFPHSLMLAFTAEYAGGEIRVDADEIAEAQWFGPGDAMPRIPHGISIASDLIQANLPAGLRVG